MLWLVCLHHGMPSTPIRAAHERSLPCPCLLSEFVLCLVRPRASRPSVRLCSHRHFSCSVVRSPNASPEDEYPIPFPMPCHVPSCHIFTVSVVHSSSLFPLRIPPSQTQPIQTQPIPTPHPPHHPQLEKLLLPRRRPAPNIQLLRPQRIPEPLTTAIAPSPPATVPLLLLGDGHRPMVMRPRRV